MTEKTVSHYRILSKLGEGAMGVVYHVEDTNLRCHRAMKFLPPHSLETADEKKRFLHEARAAAALNHPAICTVYEIDEDDGQMFIVMEFLPGTTLRQKMAQGPLDLRETLLIAIQVAEGLQEAHEQGILHRDIKPANIMITERSRNQTQAKIMDFGLALLPNSTRLTRTGSIVGTIAYMSPEQLRGEGTDRRGDIWSLGVALYEMVAGHLPFAADNEQAVRYAIRNSEPASLASVREDVPTELEMIVRKALAKKREDRYESAEELLHDLRNLYKFLDPDREDSDQLWTFKYPGGKRLLRTSVIGLAIATCVTTWLYLTQKNPPPPLPVYRPLQITSAEAWEGDPCITPDGGRIAYASNETGNLEIYVVDAHGGRPVRVTENPANDQRPAWYPDGGKLAFVSDRGGKTSIWKTGQLGGGATLLVPDADFPAISPDGRRITFTRCTASGNSHIAVADIDDPTQFQWLTTDEKGYWSHKHPAWSPDGSTICYADWHNLWLVPAKGGEARQLTSGGLYDRKPVWSSDGRSIYFSSAREKVFALWRVGVDGGSLQRLTPGSGPECYPTLSKTGVRLAYSTQQEDWDVVVLDRVSGKETRLPGLHDDKLPAISRDGKKIAFVSNRWGGSDQLWLVELVDGVPRGAARRLTDQKGDVSHPAISPDGMWIAYYLVAGEERDIWILPIEGGRPIRFTDHPASDIHPAWSPDGTRLVFVSERGHGGVASIWMAEVHAGKRVTAPRLLQDWNVGSFAPVWSPNGRMLAFTAAKENGFEVWVMPVDGSAPPRCLTNGANASRVRWDTKTDTIWASGFWGEQFPSLHMISPSDGNIQSVEPQVDFGRLAHYGLFDMTPEGDTVVICRIGSEGNIWVLEARDGTF